MTGGRGLKDGEMGTESGHWDEGHSRRGDAEKAPFRKGFIGRIAFDRICESRLGSVQVCENNRDVPSFE
jgi:hypothetical protein